MEHTLMIIKPDGVKKHISGEILKDVEGDGLKVK